LARSLTIVYEAVERVTVLDVSPVESPKLFMHISYIIYWPANNIHRADRGAANSRFMFVQSASAPYLRLGLSVLVSSWIHQ
jgi:hypothetical protein